MTRCLTVAVLTLAHCCGTLAGRELEAKPVRVTRTFGAREPEPCRNTLLFLFSPEVVADRVLGTVRLARSALIADEIGATDFQNTVSLRDTVWAKKVFALDAREATAAELFLYGDAARIEFNGTALDKTQPLVSTGWRRVPVPVNLLRTGTNEVVLCGPGSILVEQGARPGRSFRSTDAGKTWSNGDLGGKGTAPGEYLLRLRLTQHARRGWAMSPAFDLWTDRPGGLAGPGRVALFHDLAGPGHGQPAGTTLVASLRTGPTPTPDSNWTGWTILEKNYNPPGTAGRHRWAQLRFEMATDKALISPEVPERFTFAYDFVADAASAGGQLIVKPQDNKTASSWLPTSVPFVYEEPSGRLQRLRQRHHLDKVIAPGKTEMEQLMLLRHWVRHQWHTAWEGDAAGWMPPWDALEILDGKDRPDCLTMCTHYAAVFTQCALALGWNARHCILDHHCVSEVFVNQHGKWVMMDAGNSKERPDCNLHFERDGVPQSALELHLAQRSNRVAGLKAVFTPAVLAAKIAPLCRPAPPLKGKVEPRPEAIDANAELGKYPVCGLENYRRYAFPPRNNYLSSLLPGELYQGWSEYFYDGYCWVGDTPDAPVRSPEYSRHLTPDRPHDIDWALNWTRIHLARTQKPGDLRVQLETLTPNLARLEVRHGATWQTTPEDFTWKLSPGQNALTVRSVNRFDRSGIESKVEVDWRPDAR